MFILQEESIYLIDNDKIVYFQQLLQEHSYLSTYLLDFKRGYSFQIQIALDLFIFLTTDKSHLYINQTRSLARPLTAYLHEVLCRQYEFVKFKRMHHKNQLLALIVSIFLSKCVVTKIYKEFIYSDKDLLHENPLDFIVPLHNDSLFHSEHLSLTIQTMILKKMKQSGMNISYFEGLASSATIKAKQLEQLLLRED